MQPHRRAQMVQRLYKPLLIDSVKAKTNLPKQRFIGFDGNLCTAGTKAYGVCDVETDAGQFAPAAVLGILLVEAGGAIPAQAKITSDANGRATAITSTEEVNGYAIDSASGAGEIIRIIRGI